MKNAGWQNKGSKYQSYRHALSAKGIKNKSFLELRQMGIPLSAGRDADGDGVVNCLDCQPLNPKKQDYKMTTQYGGRKSFYGKAVVRNEGDRLILRSYSTDVAEIVDGKPIVYGMYSNTTARHIKEFLKQHGFKAESGKQIMKDYGATQSDEKKKQAIESEKSDAQFKSIAMVAQLGEIFGKTEKEKNDWKTRMLKAGLEGRGLEMPEDWNTLSEGEKKKRLDAVIGVLKTKPRMSRVYNENTGKWTVLVEDKAR